MTFIRRNREDLRPCQTESQEVGSSCKLSLCRDLRWVAKRAPKFCRRYAPVSIKNKTKQIKTKQKTHTHFKSTGLVPRGQNVTISVAILKSPLINRLLYQRMDVSQLGLTPNGKKLTLTLKLIWSRPKWVQVIASQHKCVPNEVANRPKFSICNFLWQV